MLDNCFRFAPRDSIPGLISKICKYLKEHPGWSEYELEEQIKKFISETGVKSFNGRTGIVTLDKNDVNNLKIASAYFAEGDESIDSLDLVSLYNQGVRFVFTDFNSVTSGYNLAFALEYFSASGNVVYYPMSTGSGGGGNVVSVNDKTGSVSLKVVDVSNGNSSDENAYIFIDENENYDDVIANDSRKLDGNLPEYYATAQSVNQLKNDLTAEQTARANADQALANDISDVWASGRTYAVGDYCISGNQLYKCKTAHTAGSAFNADYWDTVTLAGEISESTKFITETHTINFTYPEGQIGTRAYQKMIVNTDVSKIISLCISYIKSSLDYLPIVFFSGNSVYINIYRASTNSINEEKGIVTVTIIKKNN